MLSPEEKLEQAGAKPFAANGKASSAGAASKKTQPEENEQFFDSIRKTVSAAALLNRKLPIEHPLLGSLITCSSRVFLVGSTGTGKTMLGLAIAGGIASGSGFLAWPANHSSRVLYIDGEMPLRSLQSRVRDMIRRLADDELRNAALTNLDIVSWQDADGLGLGKFTPLNTEDGQRFILTLCEVLQPKVVIFDNVQALITGDMKDEVPWNETWPLIAALTSKNIGQVWIDHTGHDKTRQYGTSTKAWRFDSVGIMTPLAKEERSPGETAFTLSFETPGKARNRSPENWHEYENLTIRLKDDAWTSETTAGSATGKVAPSRVVFHDALIAAIARSEARGETTRQAWEAMCVHRGLIQVAGGDIKETERKKDLRRAQSELIAAKWIAVEGDRVIDLLHKWQ